MSRGLYLHIPFCARKCAYCDFYSLPYEETRAHRYVAALNRAVRTFGRLEADSVYLGGGTPTLLGAAALESLLAQADASLGIAPEAEITLEANPGTVDAAMLQALRITGCNRLSLGVQSLVDAELRALGRIHSAHEATQAIQHAAAAGFAHISADLMLGIPHQTRESLAHSIDTLTALPLDHISAYLLKIEEGTPFAQNQPAGLPEEDTVGELYLDCVERLEAAGFVQYEVSNFARPGGESRHNLNYWRCGEYLGLGPGAHSFFDGTRRYFPRDLDAFLDAGNPLALMQEDGPGGDLEERVMLQLRLREGLDTARLREECHIDPAPLLALARDYQNHGLCRVEGGTVSLTPRGFLLSNPLTVRLLETLEQS